MWIANGRGKLSALLEEQSPFILVDKLFLVSPTCIGGISVVADKEVDEVAGGALAWVWIG